MTMMMRLSGRRCAGVVVGLCCLLGAGAGAPACVVDDVVDDGGGFVGRDVLAPMGSGFEGGRWYGWRSEAGARYAWRVPRGYSRGDGFDGVVIVVGDGGLDGCVDWLGLGDAGVEGVVGGSRGVFVVEMEGGVEAGVSVFRDTLLEVSRRFPVGRMFVVGGVGGCGGGADGGGEDWGSGGGVLRFVSRFGGTAEGVVVGGFSAGEGVGGGLRRVWKPTVVLVGGDGGGVGVADGLVRSGDGAVGVLRVEGGGAGVDGAGRGVLLGLAFVDGMTTRDGDAALRFAELLVGRGDGVSDGVADTGDGGMGGAGGGGGWVGGGRLVLERFEGFGSFVFGVDDRVDEDVRGRAGLLIGEVDAAGAGHVAGLRGFGLRGPGDLVLDGGAWLGWLVALAEGWGGVPAVDGFVSEVGLDFARWSGHDAAADRLAALMDDLPASVEAARGFGVGDVVRSERAFHEALGLMDRAFLSARVPDGVVDRLRAWRGFVLERDGEVGASREEAFGFVENYEAGMRDGLVAYRRVLGGADVVVVARGVVGGGGEVEVGEGGVQEASGRQVGGAGARLFGFLSPVFLFSVLCVLIGGMIVGLVVRSRVLRKRKVRGLS